MIKIIAGEFKGRKLYTPKTHSTRPSKNILRETLFNICAPYIEDTVFLDLFAGSGAIGFEALSRGASHVIFIENNKLALQSIKKNVEMLQAQEKVTIIPKDVYSSIFKVPQQCDIIFADPPYETQAPKSKSQKLLEILDQHALLNKNGHFFLETSKKESFDLADIKNLFLFKEKIMGNSKLFEYRNN